MYIGDFRLIMIKKNHLFLLKKETNRKKVKKNEGSGFSFR